MYGFQHIFRIILRELKEHFNPNRMGRVVLKIKKFEKNQKSMLYKKIYFI